MAQLRLIAIAMVACTPAVADPVGATSGLTAPAGWRAAPELAIALAGGAKASGVVVEGSEAWAEPGRGCFATWIALRGGDNTLLAIDDVLAGLAAEKIAVHDVVKPAGDGVLALAFARGSFTGKLRARLDRDRLVALACFANAREPASCAAACATLLGAIA
jgi:hypothetical protein